MFVVDRAKLSGKLQPHHRLHPGMKLEVPVIDATNPLGEPLVMPGTVSSDGEQIRVHVPVSHGGPEEFEFCWRDAMRSESRE